MWVSVALVGAWNGDGRGFGVDGCAAGRSEGAHTRAEREGAAKWRTGGSVRGWLSGTILRDGACERWEKQWGLMD